MSRERAVECAATGKREAAEEQRKTDRLEPGELQGASRSSLSAVCGSACCSPARGSVACMGGADGPRAGAVAEGGAQAAQRGGGGGGGAAGHTQGQAASTARGAADGSLRGVAGRERKLLAEEEANVLSFAVHTCANADAEMVHLERLVALKTLFSKQLPNMPREYIVRLLFDPRHRSLTLLKGGQVIGGITYRAFNAQGFAEIVFCAVSADEQVRGYGSRLMARMKEHALREEGVDHFLTYADNNAVGYFAKQGFSATISMPRERWGGFIKDYDGGTLMECQFSEADMKWRANFPEIIARQRAALAKVVRSLSSSHVVHPPLQAFDALREREERGLPPPPGERRPRVAVQDIPGVVEAGWDPEDLGSSLCFTACVEQANDERTGYLQACALARDMGADQPRCAWPTRLPAFEAAQQIQMAALHKALVEHADAWPFAEAVDVREVPDYPEVVRDPVDLSLIGRRIVQGDYYATVQMFVADVKRMVANCKLYNGPVTIYSKAAVRLENFFDSQLLARTIDFKMDAA